MKSNVFAAAALLLANAAAAQNMPPLPQPLQDRITQAEADCQALDKGSFTLNWGAVTRPELSGDGQADWALDERFYECSSSLSLYCGTGGCPVVFLIDGVTTDILVKGWRVIEFLGAPVVVAYVHGSECGGTNLNRCVKAHIWENGQWNIVGGVIP